MKHWLQDNLLGLVLAGTAGLLLLISAVLGWAWSRPVTSSGIAAVDTRETTVAMPQQLVQMQPVEAYQVILERPIFNQSRRPEADSALGVQEVPVETESQAADLDVRLTGVVLTPEMKIVTLTPKDKGEALIVREGAALEGEQVGWSISQIDARQVTLNANDGRSMQLDLSVHDQVIAEPPKPEPEPITTEEAQEGEILEGEPLSRAEEIRQRIQERREQLRLEAEEGAESDSEEKESTRASYQDAIRNLMGRNREQQEEEASDEDEQ